jgi:hypothetical protein
LKKIILTIVFLALLIPSAYALTATIGNAKAILRVEASPDDPIKIPRTILVTNKNDIPVIITLTENVAASQFVDIHDKEFTLQPGEDKNAKLTLTIDRGGQIEIKINVAFRPEDPATKESPVGLTSNIIVLSEGPIIDDRKEVDSVEVTEEKVIEDTSEETTEDSDSKVNINFGGGTDTNKTLGDNSALVIFLVVMAILVIAGVSLFGITKYRR